MNINITGISKQCSKIYLVVSDGKEYEREKAHEIGSFKEQSERFIQQKYGSNLEILSVTVDYHGETFGYAWIEISPRTPGIVEMISEDYGLQIKEIA